MASLTWSPALRNTIKQRKQTNSAVTTTPDNIDKPEYALSAQEKKALDKVLDVRKSEDPVVETFWF